MLLAFTSQCYPNLNKMLDIDPVVGRMQIFRLRTGKLAVIRIVSGGALKGLAAP